MLRPILAVLAGYAAMFLVVFFGLSAAYLGMGADNAFKPGVYDVTTAWIVVWLVVSAAAAILGGIACAMLAGTRTPVLVLATLVLLLGLPQAVAVARAPAPAPADAARPQEVSNLEAMSKARQPLPVALATPVVGAAGVLLGARLVKRPTPSRG